jgi:hypothetical protein
VTGPGRPSRDPEALQVAIVLSEERLAQYLRVAERAWVAAFADQVRSGGLAWPRRRPGRVTA